MTRFPAPTTPAPEPTPAGTEDRWCPVCRIHLRADRDYTGTPVLRPLCPCCQDERDRGAA